jgi:hypothetical protein
LLLDENTMIAYRIAQANEMQNQPHPAEPYQIFDSSLTYQTI